MAARKRGGRRNRALGTVLTLAADEGALPLDLGDMKAVQAAVNLIWRDTLRQENSGQRSRTLVAVALAAMKCLEVGEYESRIQALEQAVSQEPQGGQRDPSPPARGPGGGDRARGRPLRTVCGVPGAKLISTDARPGRIRVWSEGKLHGVDPEECRAKLEELATFPDSERCPQCGGLNARGEMRRERRERRLE